jgi:glutamyl-tRNA reductase
VRPQRALLVDHAEAQSGIAPVEIRERLAFREETLAAALADLKSRPGVAEAVILSTCNRVEIIASSICALIRVAYGVQDYSVVGMLCGSVLFLVLTLRANLDFLKQLDYYYYAAY